MLYVTGVDALNLHDPSDDTTGDWHPTSLRAGTPTVMDSDESPLGLWGIIRRKTWDGEEVWAASHVRACMDLLTTGNLAQFQGSRHDYICNEAYTPDVIGAAMVLARAPKTATAAIERAMSKEYPMEWSAAHGARQDASEVGGKHRQQMLKTFLEETRRHGSNLVLKGGNALVLCYEENRVSEDLDFDAVDGCQSKDEFFRMADGIAQRNGWSYRVGKDTPTVTRILVTDAEDPYHPLKVEVSHRQRHIDEGRTRMVRGIKTYSIDELARMKVRAYSARDRVRDLQDLCYIVLRFGQDLPQTTLDDIAGALADKGLEQYDYLRQADSNALSDDAWADLEEAFLDTFDKLGLLVTTTPRQRPA